MELKKQRNIFLLLLLAFAMIIFSTGATFACNGGGGGGGGSESATNQGVTAEDLQEFLDFTASDDGDSNDNGIVDVLEIDEDPVLYESGEPVDGNPAGELVDENSDTKSAGPTDIVEYVEPGMTREEAGFLGDVLTFTGSIGLAFATSGWSVPISAAAGGAYAYSTSTNTGADRRGDAIKGTASGFAGGPISQALTNEAMNQIEEHGSTTAPNQNVSNPSFSGAQLNSSTGQSYHP